MIGRKLMVLGGESMTEETISTSNSPFLEEWKYLTIKNIKKHGYNGLVASIRFYVRGTNFLKNKLEETKEKLKNLRSLNKKIEAIEKREASGFIKTMSEFKKKIRQIKHKVKEEENL
jgi:hypothetical protein